MLKWNDIIKFVNHGNPAPDKVVKKNRGRVESTINRRGILCDPPERY